MKKKFKKSQSIVFEAVSFIKNFLFYSSFNDYDLMLNTSDEIADMLKFLFGEKKPRIKKYLKSLSLGFIGKKFCIVDKYDNMFSIKDILKAINRCCKKETHIGVFSVLVSAVIHKNDSIGTKDELSLSAFGVDDNGNIVNSGADKDLHSAESEKSNDVEQKMAFEDVVDNMIISNRHYQEDIYALNGNKDFMLSCDDGTLEKSINQFFDFMQMYIRKYPIPVDFITTVAPFGLSDTRPPYYVTPSDFERIAKLIGIFTISQNNLLFAFRFSQFKLKKDYFKNVICIDNKHARVIGILNVVYNNLHSSDDWQTAVQENLKFWFKK
jgi:hypothetical protein